MKEKIEILLAKYLKDSIKLKIVSSFILVKFFAALLNEISIIPRTSITYLNYIALILGFLAIIALYPQNYKLDTKIQKRSYLFMLAIAITSWLLNYNTQGSYGLKKIIYLVYNYYIIYISYRYLVKETNGKFTKKLIVLFIGFIFTVSLISIIMWFKNLSILLFIEDRIRSVGIRFVMSNSKLAYLLLYGIFRDPNYASTLVTISLLLSIYLFVKNKTDLSLMTKLFLVINIVISLMFIILSNSRSNLIALSLVALLWSLYYIFRTKSSIAFKVLSTSLLIVIVPLLIYSGINVSRNILTKTINPYNTKFISMKYKEEFEQISEYMNMRDVIKIDNWLQSSKIYNNRIKSNKDMEKEENFDVAQDSKKTDVGGLGNGRFDIWAEGIQLWKEKPILGYGSTNLINVLEFSGDSDSMLAKGHVLDNGYLEILLSYGILTLIIYIYFIVNSVISSITGKNKIKQINDRLMLSISVLVYIGVTAFFYSDYLIGNIAVVILINLSLCHIINDNM